MLTAKKTKHIDELHFEHQLWLNEAKFYSDELKIYQKRLEEVASKNNAEEVRKNIEHFQNQFTIQKGQLDDINHHVNMHEQWLAKYAQEHETSIENDLFADHAVIKENISTFKKLYGELKVEFNKFVGKYL